MNYMGSKLSLLEFLEKSIEKVVDKNSRVFCDLFAGTGAVGTYFKRKGYKVIANDIQYYSFVLNKQYIENHQHLKFLKLAKILPELNNIEVSERKNQEYERQYFSDENGMRCDAIRIKIEKWKNEKLITDSEYYFLLATLLETIDKRANTASVYGAFLKQLKKTAQIPFVLKPAELIINDQEHGVFNEDINKLVGKIEGDILYLDPPYNQRQYATNYHLLETVAKYDNPKIHGKTGLREYQSQKSLYCSRNQVKKTFSDLISVAKQKYIFLTYNNEGLMSLDDIKEIMSLRGKYGHFTKEYNRFKADTSENRNYKAKKTVEYLHYVVVK